MAYSKIAVAIDFSPTADVVIQRALDMAHNNAALLCLTHIVDHLPPMGFGEEPLIAPDWMIPENTLLQEAEKSLNNFALTHAVIAAEQVVAVGTPHHEIARIAAEKNCDLIVVGSHGRHGVRLLLGSTANGVLHHALCDVLAVRIPNE
ncbi:MAG: universal stress protein [Gammaproteobacteria bacterium]|nr:universal stress protein [Gammaproteobacteria bacterium]MDH5802953.1 universal stress protein [Gammaproteobacteria bacterium]